MANTPAGSNRPLSPHLQIYKPQLSWVPSITHRACGVANAVGAVLLTWWLVALATSPQAFDTVQGFMGSWLGLLMLFGWTWSVCYHFLNGIRHLVWDTGRWFEVETMEKTALGVVGGSVVLTVIIWIAVLAS